MTKQTKQALIIGAVILLIGGTAKSCQNMRDEQDNGAPITVVTR